MAKQSKVKSTKARKSSKVRSKKEVAMPSMVGRLKPAEKRRIEQEQLRFEAEHQVKQAFGETPQFKKAVSEVMAGMKAQKEKVKRIVQKGRG